MENLGEILARIRNALGIKTDKQLCEILQIPYGTLDNWKSRKRIPRGRILEISNKLNVAPEYLESGINISNNKNSFNNNSFVNSSKNTDIKDKTIAYISELLSEYADRSIIMLVRNRLLKNKYGTYFDDRVTIDDIGIIIAPASGFESEFEVSLNLIEKAYRKSLSEKEFDAQAVEWLDYRVPANILWNKLGVSLAEARLWRYELRIPENELKKIAKKLKTSINTIRGDRIIFDE